MIKISKIRLSIIFLIFVLLLTSTSCTSCFNKYTEMPNGVTLNVSSEIKEHHAPVKKNKMDWICDCMY